MAQDQTNLVIKRGDSKAYTLQFVDENDVAIDITGWIVFFTAKEKVSDDDDDAAIKKDITSHTNPTNGETKISLTSTDTAIDVKSYYYDIQVKTDTNEVKTIVDGKLLIQQDITQRTS
jgi:hypothetical protein